MHLLPAQLLTLKAAIAAETSVLPSGPAYGIYAGLQVKNVPATSDGNAAVAAFYSDTATPDFIVWKTSVPLTTVGQTFNATELAGLTSLNTSRLTNLALWLTSGVNPSLSAVRQFFDDIFSGASGTSTRPALLALWKRKALRIEKLFATGTGSDVSPATLVVEGVIDDSHIEEARNAA